LQAAITSQIDTDGSYGPGMMQGYSNPSSRQPGSTTTPRSFGGMMGYGGMMGRW
jgi:hypothetical protein